MDIPPFEGHKFPFSITVQKQEKFHPRDQMLFNLKSTMNIGIRAPAQISTNACGHIGNNMDRKGLAAMLTSLQLAGGTPEVNWRITQARKHTRDPPWL